MLEAMYKKCPLHTTDAGLLVLRIGVGLIFIVTGYMKVSDLAGTVAFFGTLGFAPFWAYLVAFVELIGGVMVLLGVYTRIASKLLAIIMIVAVYVMRHDMQTVMMSFSVLFSTLALHLAGGGKYSLMKGCCGGKCGGSCAEGGKSCGCKGDCQCGSGTCESKEGTDMKCDVGGTCEATPHTH
ncbi:MAG: DoxX family protein [Candidatus Taylorbacteria bacterium]|nr:DoxX family protein [Candidatus Taylorbacteria bacterium]